MASVVQSVGMVGVHLSDPLVIFFFFRLLSRLDHVPLVVRPECQFHVVGNVPPVESLLLNWF